MNSYERHKNKLKYRKKYPYGNTDSPYCYDTLPIQENRYQLSIILKELIAETQWYSSHTALSLGDCKEKINQNTSRFEFFNNGIMVKDK